MTYDLAHFALGDMLRCGLALRRETKHAATMEEAARAITRHLYDECLEGGAGPRSCPLVRFYKTHVFAELEPALQSFARTQMPEEVPAPQMRCLVLLASAGDEPEWNDRRRSRGHQAVPLPSEQIVRRAPMIAQLIDQLGLPIEAVVQPSPEVVRELSGKSYNVFHVEEAPGSPFIPAQRDFVQPYGIRSVLGFGGLLHTGDLYAAILFSRTPIGADVASRFRTIALDVKSVVFRFKPHEIFDA